MTSWEKPSGCYNRSVTSQWLPWEEYSGSYNSYVTSQLLHGKNHYITMASWEEPSCCYNRSVTSQWFPIQNPLVVIMLPLLQTMYVVHLKITLCRGLSFCRGSGGSSPLGGGEATVRWFMIWAEGVRYSMVWSRESEWPGGSWWGKVKSGGLGGPGNQVYWSSCEQFLNSAWKPNTFVTKIMVDS